MLKLADAGSVDVTVSDGGGFDVVALAGFSPVGLREDVIIAEVLEVLVLLVP